MCVYIYIYSIHIYIYNMYTHNTRTVSSMRNINDGLTALCVSQQRFERDHTRCTLHNAYRTIALTVDYAVQTDIRTAMRVFSVLLLLLLL
jgi:hypothetical protein